MIPAIQAGADAAVDVARARQAGGRDVSRVSLVRGYFGQQVAAQLTHSTRETLEGFDRHLADAKKLEQNGSSPMPASSRSRSPAMPRSAPMCGAQPEKRRPPMRWRDC
jgi:thioesterase domain-containing protein